MKGVPLANRLDTFGDQDEKKGLQNQSRPVCRARKRKEVSQAAGILLQNEEATGPAITKDTGKRRGKKRASGESEWLGRLPVFVDRRGSKKERERYVRGPPTPRGGPS